MKIEPKRFSDAFIGLLNVTCAQNFLPQEVDLYDTLKFRLRTNDRDLQAILSRSTERLAMVSIALEISSVMGSLYSAGGLDPSHVRGRNGNYFIILVVLLYGLVFVRRKRKY